MGHSFYSKTPSSHTLPELLPLAEKNLTKEHFRINAARLLFEKYKSAVSEGRSRDLLSLAIDLDQAEAQLFLAEVLQKKVNRDAFTLL